MKPEPEMKLENGPELFQPLVTQANAMSPGHSWLEEAAGTDAERGRDLPRGLGVLARAGASLRRTLWVSLVLAAVSLVELGVLLLYPESSPLVVWEDRVVKRLVEPLEEAP
jgi:hypothetical protein